MKIFESVSEAERNELLMYPVYITLLAMNASGKPGDTERNAAMRLSHIRTYSTTPELREFYQEADKLFEAGIDRVDAELPESRHERESELKQRLKEAEQVALKLDLSYAEMLIGSMASFKHHVSAAHGNVLEFLIFPVSLSKVIR